MTTATIDVQTDGKYQMLNTWNDQNLCVLHSIREAFEIADSVDKFIDQNFASNAPVEFIIIARPVKT